MRPKRPGILLRAKTVLRGPTDTLAQWFAGPSEQPPAGLARAAFFKGRKLAILGVWGSPGAPETLQKGGGEAPRPSEMATEAPGAAETPKTTDFRLLTNFKFPPKVQPRGGL